MRRLTPVPALLLVAILFTACEDTSVPTAATHDRPSEPLAPAGKPGGGGTSSTDAHVRITVDNTGMAVQSVGDPVYQGGRGSVRAHIFYYASDRSRSGDLVFDPDIERGKNVRKLQITFGAPVAVPAGAVHPAPGTYQLGPFINFKAIMQLAAPQSGHEGLTDGWILEKVLASNGQRGMEQIRPTTVTQQVGFQQINLPGCERLRYDRVTITRTAGSYRVDGYPIDTVDGTEGKWDAAVRGAWTVATEAGHTATCVYASGGQLVDGAVYADMPFALAVEEL